MYSAVAVAVVAISCVQGSNELHDTRIDCDYLIKTALIIIVYFETILV